MIFRTSRLVGYVIVPWRVYIYIYRFSGCFTTPLEHTPKPLPTSYKGIPFIVGQGDCLGCVLGVCCNFLWQIHSHIESIKLCVDFTYCSPHTFRSMVSPGCWEDPQKGGRGALSLDTGHRPPQQVDPLSIYGPKMAPKRKRWIIFQPVIFLG